LDKNEKRKYIRVKRDFGAEAAEAFPADGMLATSSARHARRFHINNKNEPSKSKEIQSETEEI
jgi:hypothetical protein